MPRTDWDQRVAAAQACIDRFSGRPFAWGTADCARVVAFLLRQRGHGVRLAQLGGYSTAAGALRALRRTGFATLQSAFTAEGFPPIAPASAWPGDIVAIPAEAPWDCALTVRLSNTAVLTAVNGLWVPAEPKAFIAAWRID